MCHFSSKMSKERPLQSMAIVIGSWDAIEDKCYADKPETIDALKDNIREAVGEIHTYIHNWSLQPIRQDY